MNGGHQLYKFTQHSLSYKGRITPWWSSVNLVIPGDTGLKLLLERSERLGVKPAEFARARNAVTNQWNSMSGLLIGRLIVPAYGFVGRVATQRMDEDPAYKNVKFIGGAIQIWIPNLTDSHIRKV